MQAGMCILTGKQAGAPCLSCAGHAGAGVQPGEEISLVIQADFHYNRRNKTRRNYGKQKNRLGGAGAFQ